MYTSIGGYGSQLGTFSPVLNGMLDFQVCLMFKVCVATNTLPLCKILICKNTILMAVSKYLLQNWVCLFQLLKVALHTFFLCLMWYQQPSSCVSVGLTTNFLNNLKNEPWITEKIQFSWSFVLGINSGGDSATISATISLLALGYQLLRLLSVSCSWFSLTNP